MKRRWFIATAAVFGAYLAWRNHTDGTDPDDCREADHDRTRTDPRAR